MSDDAHHRPGAVHPPGWYPDSQNADDERWFDGADWTSATRQRLDYHVNPVPGKPRFKWITYDPNPPRHSGPLDPRDARIGITGGLVFLVAGAGIALTTRPPENMSGATTGTVTRIDVAKTPNGNTCHPLADFVVGGQKYAARLPRGLSSCSWHVGQQVALAYDPASPANAMIPATGATKYMPWSVAGLGALLAGYSLRVKLRKKAPGPNPPRKAE